MLRQFTYYLFILLLVACSSKQRGSNTDKSSKEITKQTLFEIESPQNGRTFKNNETIVLEYTQKDNVKLDSCILYINGIRNRRVENSDSISAKALKMGVSRFTLNFYTGSDKETQNFALKIVPTAAPVHYKYTLVKEYPHDERAYTQGLYYHEGLFYEGTGQLGLSELRKVKPETGKVLLSHKIADKYFGEGICYLNNRIYQLTWQNNKGFVYDPDFNVVSEFAYASEGWGITTDGKHLWMSDGSHLLYKINPENMTIIDEVEVYTNTGQVKYLNELEYIEGEIWANVYTSDYIVRIKPETGEVLGIIDLKGILNQKYYNANTDVLNGIAYDSLTKRIWVTGKNWPKLFEIKTTPSTTNSTDLLK